ncbi:hypothetical protein ACVW1A_000903 [Bradyrhizobium sp. LB1.3]
MRMHREPSLEGCAAKMQPAGHPSRLPMRRFAPHGSHLRMTVMD